MSKPETTIKHSASVGCRMHEHHDHQHGESCGHVAVKHGDHVDYEHDGHLHRVHGKHVDECGGANAPQVTLT
jgi:hypothetical protein